MHYLGAVSVGATGLDHETFAEYNLIIQAQENQTPQTSILTSLIIFVTDVNEYAPAFTSSSYQANISEASSIGRAILQVETTDSDLVSIIFIEAEFGGYDVLNKNHPQILDSILKVTLIPNAASYCISEFIISRNKYDYS